MAGFSDYGARKVLDHLTGKAAFLLPTVYVALFTTPPVDGGGGVEISGNNYGRAAAVSTSWASATGSAPSSTQNASSIVFPTSSGSWPNAVAWALFDGVAGGSLLFWDYIGAYPWRPFSCSAASPGVLASPGHGYANGDVVVVSAEMGGALPTTGGTWSGSLTIALVTADTFTAGINTSGTGTGMVRKITPTSIASGQTVAFPAGSLVIRLA